MWSYPKCLLRHLIYAKMSSIFFPTQNIHWVILSSSVQFSHSVVSDSLQPHESQHARPPCPSPTPGAHSDSCPSSQWCHPAISSSVIPFSSCPQSLPASESFPMSQLFTWGGQNTGASALASFPPKKSQGWSPSEWTGWISLQSKGLSRVFSNTTVQKHQFFVTQLSSQSNSHIHTWPWEKPWPWIDRPQSFVNYKWNCYKYLCAGFCVNISFQLIWVNTTEHDFWIIW